MIFTRLRDRLRYEYRYYFVRRKAPLSSILWQRILRREYVSGGMFPMWIAWTYCDGGLEVSYGAPGDNHLTIHIHDPDNTVVGTVVIPLTYRQAKKIDSGLRQAFRLSRALGGTSQD